MASLQSAAIITKVLLTECPHVHPAGSYPQSSAQRRCEREKDNGENVLVPNKESTERKREQSATEQVVASNVRINTPRLLLCRRREVNRGRADGLCHAGHPTGQLPGR